MKSIAAELPHWSGIGSRCNGLMGFEVEDLLHWQSGQDAK